MINRFSMLILSICAYKNLYGAEVDSSTPPQGQIFGKRILEERKKGTRLWSLPCAELSRNGYGYGGIFASRWGTAILWTNPYVHCLKDGEPAFTSQIAAQTLNGWMEGWLIAKMERDLKVNFTTYGVVEGGLLGFEPTYYSFAKKLVALRSLLQSQFELYRASIPTTIERFEQALDSIVQESGFASNGDAVECLKKNHSDHPIEFSSDNKFYRITDRSVIFEDPNSVFRVQRTHYPWQSWTRVHQSAALSCNPTLIKGLANHLKSKDATTQLKKQGASK